MDLLSIMKILEHSNLVRELQYVKSFAGFDNREVVMWVNENDNTITVNGDVVSNFWKCFLIKDLEGIWYFVVMYTVEDSWSKLLMPVVNLESLVIS